MLEIFKQLTVYLAAGVETAAAIIIGLAAIQATIRALALFLNRRALESATEDIRLGIGTMAGSRPGIRARRGIS